MRCYFSGSHKDDPLFLIPHRRPHLMISFYDMRHRSNRKILKSFIRQLRGEQERSIGSIFMDSGAYSLHKYFGPKKKTREDWSFYTLKPGSEFRIYCDRYASFLKSMKEEVSFPEFIVSNVDAIGNPDLTWKIQMFFEQEHGLRPVPVVHLPDSEKEFPSALKYLERYLGRGHEMIGLGGFASRKSPKKKIKWCDAAFNLICPESNKRLPTVKVHGFAMFHYELVCRYPWWSVDATTWFNPAVMGYVYLPYWSDKKQEWDYTQKARIVNFSEQSQHKDRPGHHITNISPGVRQEVERWLDSIGSEEFAMTEPRLGDWRAEANLIYWKNLEESRPEWPHPWKPEKIKEKSL
jgi:hypothetical protein